MACEGEREVGCGGVCGGVCTVGWMRVMDWLMYERTDMLMGRQMCWWK